MYLSAQSETGCWGKPVSTYNMQCDLRGSVDRKQKYFYLSRFIPYFISCRYNVQKQAVHHDGCCDSYTHEGCPQRGIPHVAMPSTASPTVATSQNFLPPAMCGEGQSRFGISAEHPLELLHHLMVANVHVSRTHRAHSFEGSPVLPSPSLRKKNIQHRSRKTARNTSTVSRCSLYFSLYLPKLKK